MSIDVAQGARRAALKARAIDFVSASFAVAIALAFAIRITNPVLFDLRDGHDVPFHVAYLEHLLRGRFLRYYVAPYYYVWTFLHGLPWLPSLRSGAINADALMSRAVAAGNFHLFLWFALGIWKLGGRLRLPPPLRLGWVALAVAFPPVHRSLNMSRPENLLLALVPWTLVLADQWREEVEGRGFSWRSWRLWALAACSGLLVIQKISGASVILPLVLLLFMGLRRDRPAVRRSAMALVALFCLFAGALATVQRATSGAWFFEHPIRTARRYQHRAPPAFFVTVKPQALWERPYRDEHRDALPDILALDLFGDYWQYSIFNARSVHPRTGRPRGPSLARARLALVAATVFGLLFAWGTVQLVRRARERPGPEREASLRRLVPPFLALMGLIQLALTCLVIFHPGKGDTIKIEYVIWCPALAALPLLCLLEGTEGARTRLVLAALWFLAAVGLYQSSLAT